MQSEPPRKPKKRTNDAPPSPRAAPCPLAPAPTNASDEPIQQAPLQKRHRRTLTDEERLEVAATRKRGACDECRRKKEKCRHPLKRPAIDQFSTGGVTPALQRSESQDSWCSVTSTGSHYSETSKLGGDRFVATSVNAGPLAGVDQLSSSPLDRLNRSYESHQGYGMPVTEVYSASVVNGLGRSFPQMSQGDIVSQNRSHLWAVENEPPSIPPPLTFPRQNEPWPETSRSHRANGKDPEYLVDFQSSVLPSAECQQIAGFPEAGMAYQGSIQAPRLPHCHGCFTCNPVVLETTPVGPQPGMNLSLGISSGFDSLSSGGIREKTVPDHLFHNNLLLSQVVPQNSVFMDPMGVELPTFSSQSQFTFGTNTSPQYGRNTFEGYEQPSSSSNGTFMMMNRSQQSLFNHTTQFSDPFAPGTLEFSQTSTNVLHSPQPLITDQDFPPLNEPPCLNAQPDCTFANFR